MEFDVPGPLLVALVTSLRTQDSWGQFDNQCSETCTVLYGLFKHCSLFIDD